MPDPKHFLYVRLPGGKRVAVNVQPVVDHGLACRLAELLASTLAEENDEYIAAPRFAFAVWDALAAAEVDRCSCTVEVLRRAVSRAGKRSKTITRIPVARFMKSKGTEQVAA